MSRGRQGAIQVMERDQPALNVRAGTIFSARSEHTRTLPAFTASNSNFLVVSFRPSWITRSQAVGIPALTSFRTDIAVNVESVRIGRRKVAEDELGRALALGRLPDS